MLRLSRNVVIPDDEIEIRNVRSSGPGGQKVNKTATAVHLFFDVVQSSLPEGYKERLLESEDSRLTAEGVFIVKAQEHRSLEKNLEAARARLREWIASRTATVRKRKPTRPSRTARNRRTDQKKQRGRIKAMRRKVDE